MPISRLPVGSSRTLDKGPPPEESPSANPPATPVVLTTSSTRDLKALPWKYRILIPEYIKDYVSLNLFAAKKSF